MDKIQKFLLKLSKKERALFLEIFADIQILKLDDYDIKPLKGHPGIFRLRKGQIRIVFAQMKNSGIIVNMAFRKDIYKDM